MSKKKYGLTCAHCGGDFVASRKDAKHCSAKCRKDAHAKRNQSMLPARAHVHAITRLAEKEGVNWIKMEYIRNQSGLLYKGAGTIPETLRTNIYLYRLEQKEHFQVYTFERIKK